MTRGRDESQSKRVSADRRTASDDDGPVLPSVTRDEQDVGWGDEPSERDDDWYRRERPPHHG